MLWFLYLKHYNYAFVDSGLTHPTPMQHRGKTSPKPIRYSAHRILYPFLNQ